MRLQVVLLASAFLGVPLAASEADDAHLEIVNRYIEATHTQQQALRGVQMEMNITARLPKLAKQGTLTALKRISRLGQITYKALGFSGDSSVKQEVITRYLAAEAEERESGAIAITPANYKFRLGATLTRNGQRTYIFEITPKRKAVGLFKGELWIDAETWMPLRESGQFVKNPSVFLKKIAFVREYEIRDGVAMPKHIESKAEVRLVGRAELSINFSNYARPDGDDADDVGGH